MGQCSGMPLSDLPWRSPAPRGYSRGSYSSRERSCAGDLPFCAGGTVRDSHGSSDPTVWLIIETITCPDGTVKLRLEPDPSPGLNQTGSWTIASVTGTFERLRGSGEMEAVYDPDPPRRLT